MTYSFVILHYKTIDDTIRCVDSINGLTKISNDYVYIIIVDNASNDGSIERIENIYKEYQNIITIRNKRNFGFAKGNNIGYSYARNILNSDYIIIANNDTIIVKQDFFDIIRQSSEKYKFALMGPDIISLVDYGHQNPYIKTTIDINILKREILRYSYLLFLSKIFLYDLAQKIVIKSNKQSNDSVQDYQLYKLNCQLHGSFLIYSKEYIENEEYAFYNETFLYSEEAILFDHCNRKGYLTFYNPELKIYHKEDSATTYVNKNSTKKKREFVFKNLIDSHRVFIEYLKNPQLWR